MADTIEKRMADDSLMQCRVEDLKAENERLREQLATARKAAFEKAEEECMFAYKQCEEEKLRHPPLSRPRADNHAAADTARRLAVAMRSFAENEATND